MKDVAFDTNILIYAHCSDFPEHLPSLSTIERSLRAPDTRVNLTVGILHEFLHIITDARRFKSPPAMSTAVQMVRGYYGRTNVRILDTSESDLLNALTLVTDHNLGRKRLADTILASTLRRHGVRAFYTRNVRDFGHFDFLDCVAPTLS